MLHFPGGFEMASIDGDHREIDCYVTVIIGLPYAFQTSSFRGGSNRLDLLENVTGLVGPSVIAEKPQPLGHLHTGVSRCPPSSEFTTVVADLPPWPSPIGRGKSS